MVATEGGMVVMDLFRASFHIDTGCEPWILTKVLVKKWIASDKGVWRRGAAMERCRGQAAMVCADHIKSW
jgi:hypothetical protein